ncbi:MAG TPA: DUF2868 domain-containing protein [Steroidobacteraceae bacterium]|nr:DUF2868 domain-containing protein [Steroidobacteraceae bacterium]
MRQRALQAVLLVYAVEQSDLGGDALSLADRAQASREAADGRPLPAAGDPSAQINGTSERFLARRAEALLTRLRVRSPGIDRVLAAAAGPTGLDRSILLLGLLLGFGIAFAEGRRIDIFAYPLIGLVLWNLVVYVNLILGAFHLRQPDAAAGTAATPESAALERDGFFRRWLARTYANRAYARIDALITHSIGFNAPLAPGLRRFAADWRELGRPLFRVRARRLLHLAAILAALGLMAGYAVRGLMLRQAAGWGNTVFGPASAHAALVTLYGAASAIRRIPIPSTHDLQALAWTGAATGGGPAGRWLDLIYWTALLYIVLPRLLAVVLTTLNLWRRSATLRTPTTFPGYLAAVLRSLPAAPESKPAQSSG